MLISMAKKRFLTIPIQFQVRSDEFGLFLIPPANLKDLLLGSKPKKRGKK